MEHIVDAGQLSAVYTRLLVPSFSPDELISLATLQQETADGDMIVTGLRTGDRLGAVAIGSWYPSISAMLLAYLTVDSGSRGQGLGSRLLRETLDFWHDLHAPRLVVAEVEHPDYYPVDPDRGDPAARLRFYGQLGARVLDLPYFQEQLSPETERVYRMLLLALRVDPDLLNADGTRLVDVTSLRGMLQLDDSDLAGSAPDAESEAVRALREAVDIEGGVRLYDTSAYRGVATSRPPGS